MFRHVVPQPVDKPAQRNETDEETEESPSAPINELISPSNIYKKNLGQKETFGGRSSPGSKLRESHTRQSLFAAAQHSLNSSY